VLKSFACLAVIACIASAASAPIRQVTSEAAPDTLVPAFFKVYIYWAGRQSPLRISTPDGRQAPYIPTPNGTAEAIAADTDGTLAIAWNTEAAAGIDLHNRSGELLRTIQTGRYRPSHLSFAEDHSLWTLGWQTAASRNDMPDNSET
jgi:sugar lactone lactonase YvrE